MGTLVADFVVLGTRPHFSDGENEREWTYLTLPECGCPGMITKHLPLSPRDVRLPPPETPRTKRGYVHAQRLLELPKLFSRPLPALSSGILIAL